MSHHTATPLVACCNSSEDIVELLADVLQHEGWRALTHVTPTKLGPQPTIDFLTQLQPHACIYSVSLPYQESWEIFQAVQQAVPGCAWVVTTTNKQALDSIVGPTNTLEIMGKPVDIEEVVQAVRRTLQGA